MLTPIKIDNRIDAHLGIPDGIGKRPVIIHMHERYGIVQHTMDLGEKYVKAGYVTIVPDYFSRFTGDRKTLADGNDRCELDDEHVLSDTDAIMAYLYTVPQADMTKVAMSGVCQTGRQPILVAAKRDYLTAAVVLYGAVYDADWKSHPMRPESIETLLQEMTVPAHRGLRRARQSDSSRQHRPHDRGLGRGQEKLRHPRLSRRAARIFERHHAGPLSPAPERRGMESDHVVFEIGVRRRMEKGPGHLAL